MAFEVDDNTYFKLFSDCIPVKGHTRSIICDLGRQNFDFIPNSLYFILKKYADKSLKKIFDSFNNEEHSTLNEYFLYLYEKEYIFWCTKDELKSFPDAELKFETPSIIDNSIVDVDYRSNHDWNKIISQLTELGCSNLQIRIFDKHSFSYCYPVFDLLENSIITNVEILIPFSVQANESKFLSEFSNKYLRLSKLTVHSSPFNKNYTVANTLTNINLTTDVINSNKCCGIVNPAFFTVNMDFFAESLKYNTCLNKKISIDACGYIKNCPSMAENYGHINTTSLNDVVSNPSFLAKWKITKDDIKICMDCEFRHICLDCRAFVEHPDDPFSKPLKCSYDPYSGEWIKNKSAIPEFAEVAEFYEFKNIVF
ncbi:MAG: grasp-with-spasm system SPASM domain peptide maturase [Chitinophagales bacterium]|nr:grasp-with-spasm system SPASM domain peptide maturase [Chitinophagales bacterium]